MENSTNLELNPRLVHVAGTFSWDCAQGEWIDLGFTTTKIDGMGVQISQLDIEKYEQMVRASGWFALRNVARRVAQLYDQILAPTGLRVMQLGILRVCGSCGPISVAGLARELVAERSTIMRSLKPLIATDMLRRTRVAGGKERVLIELTSRGQTALAKAIVHWDHAQRDLIDHLGEARWSRLKTELSAIADVAP
jgi:DNA-binding MarR family transcriptional regulator